MSDKPKVDFLALVTEMHAELSTVIPLVNVSALPPIHRFIFHTCTVVSEIVDGYLTLQKTGKLTPSRILIRSCIEATFKLAAVMKEPASLLNISYTEAQGDIQLLEANVLIEKKKVAKGKADPSSVVSAEKAVADHAVKWKQERPKIVGLFPGVQLKDAYLKPWKIAEIGGLEELYGFQYILYCNFTHSTLRAAFSWPDTMPALDQSTVAHCTCIALKGVESIGGKISPAMSAKLNALCTSDGKRP